MLGTTHDKIIGPPVTIGRTPTNMTEGTVRNHEDELADLLRVALAGDAIAYRSFLAKLATSLRPAVRGSCQRAGLPAADVEDMLQDVLLAVHTKRQTWDPSQRLGPWVHAIVRYKVI